MCGARRYTTHFTWEDQEWRIPEMTQTKKGWTCHRSWILLLPCKNSHVVNLRSGREEKPNRRAKTNIRKKRKQVTNASCKQPSTRIPSTLGEPANSVITLFVYLSLLLCFQTVHLVKGHFIYNEAYQQVGWELYIYESTIASRELYSINFDIKHAQIVLSFNHNTIHHVQTILCNDIKLKSRTSIFR